MKTIIFLCFVLARNSKKGRKSDLLVQLLVGLLLRVVTTRFLAFIGVATIVATAASVAVKENAVISHDGFGVSITLYLYMAVGQVCKEGNYTSVI